MEESGRSVLYKVIGTTQSSPKKLADAWKKIYDLLDKVDIKLTLPEILLNTFKDLGDKHVDLESNAADFSGGNVVVIIVIVVS